MGYGIVSEDLVNEVLVGWGEVGLALGAPLVKGLSLLVEECLPVSGFCRHLGDDLRDRAALDVHQKTSLRLSVSVSMCKVSGNSLARTDPLFPLFLRTWIRRSLYGGSCAVLPI